MSSDGSSNTTPPRPFPAQVWLQARYGFRLPPLRFAAPTVHASGRRPFPAQVWLEQRHLHSVTRSVMKHTFRGA